MEAGEEGEWEREQGEERERESVYTYRYTVIIRMTPALRWAAMRAV